MGAYPQVDLETVNEDCIVETWVTLPQPQCSKSWFIINDPFCPLRIALYGHPFGDLYWESRSLHRDLQGFLLGSFCAMMWNRSNKMMGNSFNLSSMWKKLGK